MTQEQPCGAKASRRKRKRLLLPPQQDWQGNPKMEKPQRMQSAECQRHRPEAKGRKRMVRKSFKEVMKDDVNNTFMNVDEFADTHTVDGKEMPVLVDDNEIIEREKKMKSNMDGVYVKQKLIYVKADDFGPLPAIGRQIVFDGKRYMVTDSTDEGGVYTITMEANRTK